jgi:hypothetical protein
VPLDRSIGKPVSVIFQNRCFGIRELIQVRADRGNVVLGEIVRIALLDAVVVSRASDSPISTLELLRYEVRNQPSLSYSQCLVFGNRDEPIYFPDKSCITTYMK